MVMLQSDGFQRKIIMKKYDLIGDVHGHANDLSALLIKLDYRLEGGGYCHPERKVIFLGDFIDRGVNQKAVLDIVMPMVKQGKALAVMGNHEFNALAFHTEDPGNPGEWLRPRNNKNLNQHLAFLSDYASPKKEEKLSEVLDFFMSLPVFLEVDGIRVVHACWHKPSIQTLQGSLGPNNTLTPELLVSASRKGRVEYEAIETLLKGVEKKLPNGAYFFDKDGTRREEVRIRWWLEKANSLGELAFGHFEESVAQQAVLPEQLMGYDASEPPVFMGHYWLQGKPEPQADNVVCLDYSVAKGGCLAAYRWDGEQNLSSDKFIY